MISNEKVLKLLNDQMNFEFYSAHIYLGMASYCSEQGLDGFENWFKVQYQEEVAHAMKFFDFINSKGGKAIIANFGEVENSFDSILDALKSALHHEEEVTARINSIAKVALENADLTSFSFLQWFIDEQIEEEESVTKIITDVERVGGEGLYLIDKELAARVFTPISEGE
ncbi:MAG: ferritin [Bacilli bacterium]